MKNIRINVLGIIESNGKILAQKGTDSSTGQTFWRLPGGGIEFGENSKEALSREFLEEVGVDTKNEELLSVIENVFQYNNETKHEITFLYRADFIDPDFYSKETIKNLDKENDVFEWIETASIKNGKTILYPEKSISYLA